jgi:hypothetical protein
VKSAKPRGYRLTKLKAPIAIAKKRAKNKTEVEVPDSTECRSRKIVNPPLPKISKHRAPKTTLVVAYISSNENSLLLMRNGKAISRPSPEKVTRVELNRRAIASSPFPVGPSSRAIITDEIIVRIVVANCPRRINPE